MSEFSKSATATITPLLKQRGFKKQGAFTGSPLFDEAVYLRGRTRVTLTLQRHPYDYPNIGIQLTIKDRGKIAHRRLYSTESGETRDLIDAIADDLTDMQEVALEGGRRTEA